jgi:hypothetical protein
LRRGILCCAFVVRAVANRAQRQIDHFNLRKDRRVRWPTTRKPARCTPQKNAARQMQRQRYRHNRRPVPSGDPPQRRPPFTKQRTADHTALV